ncbi:MBL fold metallo-hydrolase RNA specificity domain-containing protein [candidate division KSB1 bacterium]
MYLTSYGGVREVTGSMHLLTTQNDRILLDCGMFQGKRKESDEKNRIMPIDPSIITNMVLSHAHIDHSGRVPILTKGDFHGRVIATRATTDACDYLLRDSAHIQESDAEYLNYKSVRTFMYQMKSGSNLNKLSKRSMNEIKKVLKRDGYKINNESISEIIDQYNLRSVQPLYTMKDAEEALTYFDAHPYRDPVTIGKDTTVTFYDAGHILGSAVSIINTQENGKNYRIMYTGDIGRFNKPIIKDPCTTFPEDQRDIDLLIMESTYGNRFHEPAVDLYEKLKNALLETIERGGSVLIPSFAFGRTQELVYILHELYDNKEVPRMPIYVDSPLAINLTKVFGEHPEVYDEETHETFLQSGKNPFMFDQMHFVKSVQESMALMKHKEPNIVIASSGMCEAGRVLHHLRNKVHDPRNTILIVGYMAQHTLGRRLLESGKQYEESGRTGHAPILKFMNKTYPLYAHVKELGGFSAHGDRNEMMKFLNDAKLKVKKIALVHGEEDQLFAYRDYLTEQGYSVAVPRSGEIVRIN